MIYDEKNKNFKKLVKYFSLLIAASIFVFVYPVSEENINSMVSKIDDRNLWIGAITVASSSEGNLNIINHEIRTNFLNIYNLKINIFFLIMGALPIHFLLARLDKNQIIKIENKKLYLYFYLSIIPYLAFFAIGDTGRWLHIISIVSFGFLSQYPINMKNYNNIILRSYFLKVLIFILLIIYCFFVRLPHAGNLEKKEITIWGGLNKKFEAAYNIYFNEKKDDKFDFNKRFKKKLKLFY